MPQPSKLTAEVRRIVLEGLRLGLFHAQCAALAGVDIRTLDRWLRKGNSGGASAYVSFAREVERASAEGERDYVGQIQRAAQGGAWQASAWILERRAPKRWGLQIRVTVEAEQAAFLERLRERLRPDEFARVVHAAMDDGSEAAALPSVSALEAHPSTRALEGAAR